MSFREKSAWITLVSVVLCFGVYYGATLSGLIPSRSWGSFHLGVGCIVALVVLQVGLHIVAVLLNPAEARTPRDEREKMIEARSHTIGYPLLMVGMVVVVIATHVPGNSPVELVNLGVGAMVISGLAVALAQIVMFRRGG